MYIRRKVYSSYIDECGEERLFSTSEIVSEEAYLGQREFNSKAAKALNNKYLKQVASKTGIPVYKSAGFKTVEVDPREWKNSARFNRLVYRTSKLKNTPAELPREYFNKIITDRPVPGSASYQNNLGGRVKSKRKWKESLGLEHYDHAGADSLEGPRKKIIRQLKQ